MRDCSSPNSDCVTVAFAGANALCTRGNCFHCKGRRKLRATHPSLPQVEQHFRRQPSESQIGLLTACAVLRTDSRAQEQLSIPREVLQG